MTALTVPELFGVLVASIVASLAVLWVLGLRAGQSSDNVSPPEESTHASRFLFHGDTLVDYDAPSPAARPNLIEELSDWSDLRHLLAERFEGLPHSLTSLPSGEAKEFTTQLNGAQFLLTLKRRGSATRAELRSEERPVPFTWLGALSRAEEADQVQNVLDHAPLPLWRKDAEGHVIWRNDTAIKIENALGGLPVPHAQSKRFSVPVPDADAPDWYEMDDRPLQEGHLLCATCVTPVIQAESAQRDFVQTLAKTFAHLTTGLAIFDKSRQLALFNPALVDLTSLPVAFLSARPDVIRFFDELRERQVLPEPKSYTDWRDQIRDVIAKAHDGTYSETWNLPAGVTYRVTGRPHPDGAVAFLFQDISAEIMQTRNYRSQLDLSQSVIDELDQAIVVLSPGNLVLMCNAAGSELLGIDPSSSFADMSLHDLLQACRVQFAGDAVWTVFEAGLRDGAAHHAGPGRYLNTLSGQRLRYQIKPLAGGARLLSFSIQPELTARTPINAAE